MYCVRHIHYVATYLANLTRVSVNSNVAVAIAGGNILLTGMYCDGKNFGPIVFLKHP